MPCNSPLLHVWTHIKAIHLYKNKSFLPYIYIYDLEGSTIVITPITVKLLKPYNLGLYNTSIHIIQNTDSKVTPTTTHLSNNNLLPWVFSVIYGVFNLKVVYAVPSSLSQSTIFLFQLAILLLQPYYYFFVSPAYFFVIPSKEATSPVYEVRAPVKSPARIFSCLGRC